MKVSAISLFILCFVVFISSYFAVVISIGDFFTSVSNIFILILAIPVIFSLTNWLGFKKGLTIFLLLGGLSLGIEMVAIVTGIPYGNFQYSSTLGFHVFNVPISVALAYLPILLGSFTLGNHILKSPTQLSNTLLSAQINTAIDFLIDPVAVKARFWFWPDGGFYYEVPLINFVGWLCTGFLYSQIFLVVPAFIGCIILAVVIFFNLQPLGLKQNNRDYNHLRA